MSEWFDITDQDNVDLSDDGKEVHILFATNRNGNRYVSVPVDILVKLLAGQQSAQADKCPECGAADGYHKTGCNLWLWEPSPRRKA